MTHYIGDDDVATDIASCDNFDNMSDVYASDWNDSASEQPIMNSRSVTRRVRFKDVVQDYYRAGRTGISRESLKSGAAKILSLDQLELDFPSEANEPDLLRQFISEDVEKRLMRPIRGRPKATFQFLLLSKLDGQTWDEISEILGPPPISKQTLSSFFNRQLQGLMPYFLKGLSD